MATLAVSSELVGPDLVGEPTLNALPVLEFLRSDRGYEGMEDSEVMLRLRAGDMAAFDYLLARYRRPIIHFMYRMVHNEAVAEEMAQEVFLRVYRSRESYRAEAKFSTWLYRIATNLGVNHARDTRHERAASTVYLDETDEETGTSVDVADSTPGVEDKILRRERMAAIKQHVMALPRAAADGGVDAQVRGDGLQADRRGAEVERVSDEVACCSGLIRRCGRS